MEVIIVGVVLIIVIIVVVLIIGVVMWLSDSSSPVDPLPAYGITATAYSDGTSLIDGKSPTVEQFVNFVRSSENQRRLAAYREHNVPRVVSCQRCGARYRLGPVPPEILAAPNPEFMYNSRCACGEVLLANVGKDLDAAVPHKPFAAAWQSKFQQSRKAAEEHDYLGRIRDANHSRQALAALDKLTRQDFPELLTLNPAAALSAKQITSGMFRNDVYVPEESDLHSMASRLKNLPQIRDESTVLQAAIVVRAISGLTNPTLHLSSASFALALGLLDGLEDAVFDAFRDVRAALQPRRGPN